MMKGLRWIGMGLLVAAASSAFGEDSAVRGRNGWLFFVPELKHLESGKFWGKGGNSDPLPAILDFAAQCKKAGVALLLVPVPAKATIYGDLHLFSGRQTPTGQNGAFFAELRKSGVKVLDLSSSFKAASGRQVFCKQDSHWSGSGIDVASTEITKFLRGVPGLAAVPKKKYSANTITAKAQGDLGSLVSPPAGLETLKLQQVAGAKSDRNSPVVLLGDSHNLIFSIGGDMVASSAGLPEALTAKLGFPVDVVAVRGSGATPARINLARRRDNLKGKKAVVWVFTAREFTQGQGWRKVPVVR